MNFMQSLRQIFLYAMRPILWWTRSDKTSDHLSYAMSIEAIPNPQGWVTGAVVSFFVECDITHNTTEFERIINFRDEEVIYTKDALDDEDVRVQLAERINKKINIPLEADFARRTINMQVLIEGIAVWAGILVVVMIPLAILGL